MSAEIRMKKEWLVLDGLYGIGFLGYFLIQLISIGKITDILFLILLSAATVFLNYRQYKLYQGLVLGKDGKAFFAVLQKGDILQQKLQKMFCNRGSDAFAVLFAFLFCCVMWQFHIWEKNLIVKVFFTVFLFCANIPTGLAIVRLVQYFIYSVQWIYNVQLDVGVNNCFATRFIKKMRSSVLFTVVTYCALSLSSILFTDIEINIIVILYTCFAAVLVLASLLITDLLLARRVKQNLHLALDQIDDDISKKINDIIEQSGTDGQCYESFKRLIDVKAYMQQQNRAKLDFEKILSNIGLLFITIIPVLLQWFLDFLKI